MADVMGGVSLKVLSKVVLSLALASLPSMAASGQQEVQSSLLTLRQAMEIALEKNPLRKEAIADTQAASAGIREARSLLMPHLSFSETATRSNDPVYVFGSKLRQQRFTAADLALNRLNAPVPFGNFTTRFSGSWNLFDSFATWHDISRAKQMNEAARHQLDRTDQEIVFRVLTSYYEVLLAARQSEVADQSIKTAQSIIDRSQARFDSGLAVESDLLTAKVRMADRRQEAIRARNTLETARAELNTAMGMPIDASFQAVEGSAEDALPIPMLRDLETQALSNRPDLKRIACEEAAQRHTVSMAKSSFGPRVNAFGGWETDNPTFITGGGGNNWQAGFDIQFDIFQGGAKRAALSRERALEEKALANEQGVRDAVRLEVRRAFYDLQTSRQQIEVARAAIAQAQESLRINADRYESGLTTITGLLGAEDAARRSQADYWEAIYHFRISYASLELATGNLNP